MDELSTGIVFSKDQRVEEWTSITTVLPIFFEINLNNHLSLKKIK